MASDKDEAGKLFVGGLHRQTTEETLRSYFESFGEVKDCVLMKDKETGFSRGFGFVTYSDPSCVTTVLNNKPHTIDSKPVDPKPCTPRHIQQQKKQTATQYTKGHKIFIGGISMEASENDVKGYFQRYGTVVEVVFVVNKQDPTRPHKGFGFVTFEDESSVDQACAKHYHVIKDKRVEAKKAESREKMDKANQNQNYNMGYGNQGPMQGGNMGYQQQGMNAGQNNWMGPQMGYGYGNQNFPTAYPQQYNNQAYGYGYGNMQAPQGYGNMQQQPQQGYGNMQQQQQPPQQQMGQGYGNMSGNYGMMGGGLMPPQQQQQPPPQSNMQQNNSNSGGDMGNIGNYQQNQSSYGPTKGSGDYNNMGPGAMSNQYGNQGQNPMGGGSAGGGSGGYGPPKQGGGNTGYHPYRR
ncbi:uncharacterized protein LOC143460271 [Clavelina lepadiformis]|uniref:RRM domain-containing protein n=1 Tax=Clavelina lepadiformis TaxID=159417 RepID=A0ABP0GCF1_CLALP